MTFGFPGFHHGLDGGVCDGRGVVLIGQAGEVVPELMNEQVVGPVVPRRDGREGVEDPAAAVGLVVDQYGDELVGRPRSDVAQRTVLEREHVTLGPEGIVGRTHRSAPVHAGGGPRDARLGRWRAESPDVEIVASGPEWFMAKKCIDHPPGVARISVGAFLRGITVADQQEVDLFGWGAMLLEGHECLRRRRCTLDEHPVRVDDRFPNRLEGLRGVAMLHCDANGRRRTRKAQRFVKAPMRIAGFFRGCPLAEDRRVSARVQQASAGLAHLESVCAGVCVIDRARGIARPGERLEHDAVDREHLEAATSRVHEIDPQRRWRCDWRRGRLRVCAEADQAGEQHN